MNIELLPVERWSEIQETVGSLFDAALPDAAKANIVAAIGAGGEIEGFLIVETLVRVGQIYSQNPAAPKKMIDFVLNSIPPGASVVVIASAPRFARTCRKFGMREIEGILFRRDF